MRAQSSLAGAEAAKAAAEAVKASTSQVVLSGVPGRRDGRVELRAQAEGAGGGKGG